MLAFQFGAVSTSVIRGTYPSTNQRSPLLPYKIEHPPRSIPHTISVPTFPFQQTHATPPEAPNPTRSGRHGPQGRQEAGRREQGGEGGGEDPGGQEAQGREAAAGGQDGVQGGRRRGEDEGPEEGQQGQEGRGDLQDLHLQGAEAGPPRHRHLLQGHVHHELLHQRHLREARRRVRQARPLQQEAHHHLPGDPDLRPPRPPRRARQARRLRGHQGRDQVHILLD
ncbi:hypothetical protein VPH35_010796 [Triticum aestivum]